MIKISVIVPIYNSEKFLNKCVDSILAQTLDEIEIILINDGSTDQSHNICLEYSKKYKDKIVYINNNNIGCSASRNLGIKQARGEYIAFVDSDDFIEKTMYEDMYKKAKEEDSDVVVCGMKYIYYYGYYKGKERNLLPSIDINYESKEYLTKKAKISNACNKIFRKYIIEKEKILFPEGSHSAEDFCFCFLVLGSTSRVSYICKAYYNYIHHGNNSVYNLEKRVSVYTAFNMLYKNLKEKNLFVEKYIKRRFIENFIYDGIKMVYFSLIDYTQVNEEQYLKYDKIFSTELKNIVFLNIKLKLYSCYYRNLVKIIRKLRVYFILKKVKEYLKNE